MVTNLHQKIVIDLTNTDVVIIAFVSHRKINGSASFETSETLDRKEVSETRSFRKK